MVSEAGSYVPPVTPIIGDGKAAATFQVLTDDPSARFKVKLDKGKIASVTPIAGGALVEFIPPAVTERTAIAVTVQVRGATSEDLAATIDVVPAFGGGFDVTTDPPVVAAGQTASVKIRPTSHSPQADDRRRWRVSVSAGQISEAMPAGDGTWVARYTPPAAKDPQVIAIGVVDAAAPWDVVGQGVVGVSVTRSVTFDAPPDSNNVLSVNGREYGPTKASSAGKVSFDVPLSPGQKKAKLSSVAADGTKKESNVEMPFPTAGGVAIGALPDKAPAGSKLPIWLFCRTADLAPCPGHSAGVNTLTGSFEPTTLVSLGLERTTWTLPSAGTASFTYAMDQQRAAAAVTTTAPLATVSLAADPPTLPAGKKDFTVIARVKDPKGTAVVGRPPELVASGATAVGKPKDNGDGSYSFAFKLSGTEATVRGAPASLAATGLPPQRLVVWTDRPTVYADGTSKLDVMVVAEDALGMPVPNVDLTIGVPVGDGSLAPTAKTGGDGVARLSYRVGSKPGAVGIVVEAQGLKAATSLWQAAVGQAAPDVHTVGPADYRATVDRWRQTLPSITVQAATAAQPAVVAAATPPPTMTVSAAATFDGDPNAPSGPPKVAKPKGSSAPSDAPRARVRGRLIDAPQRYSSAAVADGDTYPWTPAASFALSPAFGAVGLGASAEAWKDKLGADASISLVAWRMAIADKKPAYANIDVHVGGRYKVWESGDASAYAGLGLMRGAALLFEYPNDTRATAKPKDRGLIGGRLAAGAQIEHGGLLVRAELSELFAAAPVYTRLDTTFEIPIKGAIAINAGVGLFARHARFKSPSDGKLQVNGLGVELAAGATLLAF